MPGKEGGADKSQQKNQNSTLISPPERCAKNKKGKALGKRKMTRKDPQSSKLYGEIVSWPRNGAERALLSDPGQRAVRTNGKPKKQQRLWETRGGNLRRRGKTTEKSVRSTG